MKPSNRKTPLPFRPALILATSCLLWLSSLLPVVAGSSASAATSGAPAATGTAATSEARLVESVRRGGVTILIRHSATEPGVGDPPGFNLTDCASQRNLNDAGREQARRLGRWFEANGLRPTAVRVSPWCRARETAMLAFGQSQDWIPLSNLLSDRTRQVEQTRAVRDAIVAGADGTIDVLVSHGVSISAFVDVYLRQGEMVVVRRAGDGGIEIVGQLLVP